MRLLQTLRGTGTVTAKSGKTAVQYALQIYQHDIPVGVGTIPGLKEVRGRVTPFCGVMGETLLLELQDGATVEIFFSNNAGSITAKGGITASVAR